MFLSKIFVIVTFSKLSKFIQPFSILIGWLKIHKEKLSIIS